MGRDFMSPEGLNLMGHGPYPDCCEQKEVEEMGYRISADQLFEMWESAYKLEKRLRAEIYKLPLFDQIRFWVRTEKKIWLIDLYYKMFGVRPRDAEKLISAYWDSPHQDRLHATLELFKIKISADSSYLPQDIEDLAP